MKRIVAWTVLALCLLCICHSYAEGVSELQMQIDQCNFCSWSEGAFSSVTVPEGMYIVGVDIPAGEYYIKSASPTIYCHVISQPWDIETYELSMQLYHPRNWSGFYGQKQSVITIENNDRFTLEQTPLIFVPKDYVIDFTGNVGISNQAILEKYCQLHQRLRKELQESPAWQSGNLPEGIWEIGKAIPAAKWTIWNKGDDGITIYLGNDYSSETQVFPERCYTIAGSGKLPMDLSAWKLMQIVGGPAVLTTYSGHDMFDYK